MSVINYLNIARDKRYATYLAKKVISEIVHDVATLEDVNITIPEVQTLIDGITIGGRPIEDVLLMQNQIDAWKMLFTDIESGEFCVDKQYIFKLHEKVAFKKALLCGGFRTRE